MSSSSCLFTVSTDQTCRLYAPLLNNTESTSTSSIGDSTNPPIWKEISRPQIHGYDLNAIAVGECQSSSLYLFSGSDEKVIRVLEIPLVVVEGLQKLCGISLQDHMNTNDNDANKYFKYK